ncbi:MAG: sensor N-terminal transmembrane domain-containing protein [Sphingomonadales bacterium]|nr:sensor N-terminal transmembrane domain-containing protein [Sphingomonadales bacterium]
MFWSRRVSLTTRILAVNIIALGLLAASLFYIDSYRKQLIAERFRQAQYEAEIAADALTYATPAHRRVMLISIGTEQGFRLRLYDSRGRLAEDSFDLAPPSFAFIDPDREPWNKKAARAIDRGMDFVLGTPPIPDYVDFGDAPAKAWDEITDARRAHRTVIYLRTARDRTPVISAATLIGKRGEVLLTTRNAPDITQSVRDARQNLAIIVGVALIISVQLSLFLARTIVQPLRTLVRAAVRVRLGRDREVVVPRLPDRRDEIGMLARAISDMTTALRLRIDAVESFAADVAHEIKNPLASLRSALETLDKVEDPDLRRQLSAIAAHDVQRIDRLVTEIADASRIDAELSRTTFEPVDLEALTRGLVDGRQVRGANRSCVVSVEQYGHLPCLVAGDPARLERVLENLLDNAVSFSAEGGAIEVALTRFDEVIELTVSDHGPGIPPESRERVFERFHSLRPDDEAFGSHSGLGLAIARTIVEAHDGTLTATDRSDGQSGARMVATLPALDDA